MRMLMCGVSLLQLFAVSVGLARSSAVFTASPPPAADVPVGAIKITYDTASQMTTAELARLLLPNQSPSRFASHKLDRFFSPGFPLSGVEFFGRPAALGTAFCRRDGIYASVSDGSTSPTAYLAAAPKCRVRPGGFFARVQPNTAFVGAQQALRRLLALQQAAKRRNARMMVTCTTETSTNPCNRPAVSVLADLPLHKIYTIEPRDNAWVFAVMPNGPGQLYWRVLLSSEQTADQPISLSWRAPAPL
jgi:hypothetical protein